MESIRVHVVNPATELFDDAYSADDGPYKRKWKKSGSKPPSFEKICFYSTLSVTIEALFDESWATVDWIKDCSAADIECRLSSLKELNPVMSFRAMNQTTGRMIDFA